jgi:hypothetical protein
MTLNVLRRGSTRRRSREAAPEPLPIGDEDSNIFSCPVCARPLATGARRCPGCRTRLLLGVQLTRAAAFMGLGTAFGVALTTGFLVAALSLGLAGRTAADPVAQPGASPVAGPTVAPSVAPPPSVAPGPAIPATSVTALSRTAEMNARIAGVIPILEAELAEASVDTAAVAEVFRAMNADAAYAAGAAERLGKWDEAGGVAAGLLTFYGDIRATARAGLTKSLASEPAYRAAAERMLVVLAGLGPLDAASRELATVAGIDLPVVPVPAPGTADVSADEASDTP